MVPCAVGFDAGLIQHGSGQLELAPFQGDFPDVLDEVFILIAFDPQFQGPWRVGDRFGVGRKPSHHAILALKDRNLGSIDPTYHRRAAGIFPHEGIDVVVDPAGKRPEVRPTAQPRLTDVLGMERFVGVLRHVLVAAAVDIDVELLSHRGGRPEVMR